MAVKYVAVFQAARYDHVMLMLVTVFKWLTDFFTGARIETRKGGDIKSICQPKRTIMQRIK